MKTNLRKDHRPQIMLETKYKTSEKKSIYVHCKTIRNKRCTQPLLNITLHYILCGNTGKHVQNKPYFYFTKEVNENH